MGILSHAPDSVSPSGSHSIEISVRGKWRRVPAVEAYGQTIAVSGKWIKIASVQDEEYMETEVLNPEGCIQKIKEQSHVLHADIFSFAQKLPSLTPRYQYPMELASVAVARTDSFKDWWEALPQVSRKNVRRSQKRGVVIEVKGFDADVIKGICEVQNESPMRQGRPYHHYGKSLEQVRRDHGSFADRSDFICAYSENRFIGFLKLVYHGNIASVLQVNSMAADYDKRPSNALLAKAVELCEARGVSYLTYGLFNYGNKGDTSIREFKVRNGFGEMMVPTYFVPLTVWGRFCVKTRLYRGLLGILPKSVLSAALKARSKWYDLSTQKEPV
jgi:hypothetical protein